MLSLVSTPNHVLAFFIYPSSSSPLYRQRLRCGSRTSSTLCSSSWLSLPGRVAPCAALSPLPCTPPPIPHVHLTSRQVPNNQKSYGETIISPYTANVPILYPVKDTLLLSSSTSHTILADSDVHGSYAAYMCLHCIPWYVGFYLTSSNCA